MMPIQIDSSLFFDLFNSFARSCFYWVTVKVFVCLIDWINLRHLVNRVNGWSDLNLMRYDRLWRKDRRVKILFISFLNTLIIYHINHCYVLVLFFRLKIVWTIELHIDSFSCLIITLLFGLSFCLFSFLILVCLFDWIFVLCFHYFLGDYRKLMNFIKKYS